MLLTTETEVFYNLLYLEIFAVMATICAPMGASAIASLLHKQVGFVITLRMKVAYIVLLAFCWAAYIPAIVYIAIHWGDYPCFFYLIFGMIFLIAATVGDNDESGAAS